MPLVPATTPEAMAAVLRVVAGRHALSGPQRRRAAIFSIATSGAVVAIFGFGAWAGESGLSAVLATGAGIMALAGAYDLLKAYRVIEINERFVEYRMPLHALSWHLNASELRRIDVELDKQMDKLLFETKIGATRRIEITRVMSAALRA
jgi:hypothetical protein